MNKVFTHPGQPQMQVEVILASSSPEPNAPNIYTLRLRYPRIIHGEIMTHRTFSRNARSSRAVPVKTMLNEVRNMPFVPWHWGANQKGMQAAEECNAPLLHDAVLGEDEEATREQAWHFATSSAAGYAEAFMEAGYHKQIVNRLLEPFSWMDTLITSTDWINFLWLRDHEAAEPHLRDLARLVDKAISRADLQMLQLNEWHLPYIDNLDKRAIPHLLTLQQSSHPDFVPTKRAVKDMLLKISAARCARISYAPFDGDASYKREIERYDSLVKSDRVHASPLEHQATPDKLIQAHEGPYGEWRIKEFESSHFHGNFDGWIQARKLVPNECHTGLVTANAGT